MDETLAQHQNPSRIMWAYGPDLDPQGGHSAFVLATHPTPNIRSQTNVNSLQPHTSLFSGPAPVEQLVLTHISFWDLARQGEARGGVRMRPSITDPNPQTDIERWLGPTDLLTDFTHHSKREAVEEAEVYVRPAMRFGAEPIPRTQRPVRLTSEKRAAIPPESLPRTFSIQLPEEPQD